jgi:hypothetical protein
MRRVVLILLLGLLSFPVLSSAQTVSTPTGTITIPKVTAAPTLEDYLDGTPRPEEAAVTTFVQREPGDGVPASQPTEAYLSYDDQHLYVVFVARESDPRQVRASLTRREGFGNDDTVGVMLDTFRDRRRAYVFIANPLGVQLDGVNTDGREDDYSYDTIWDSEGRLTEFGYVVRMAIPFKSLRFADQPQQEWGIALARTIRRNNETSFWPYVTRRVASVLQQLAVATGLEQISPGRNIQFIPYGAFTGARFLDGERPGYIRDADARAGVDGKFVLRDAFTVDLTVNPDFSQVESDEPQVTINQRFEVFFEEKRPFFIENASYFQTPINLFFSRRIADPQAGARVTGKSGDWALAGLVIDDRAPGEVLPPDDPLYGDRAGVAVLRAQRDLPGQSAVGVLATTRRFGGSDNHVLSFDARYRLSDTWTASGQAAVSHTTEATGPALTAPALLVELDRTGRSWGAFFRYEEVDDSFRAPLGFVRRVDTRRVFPFARYTWFPEKYGLVSIRPEVSGGMLWDHGGTLQDWEASSEVQFEFKGQSQVEIGYDETMERFAGTEFRKGGVSLSAETAWLKWLEVEGAFDRGQEINFFPSAALPPFLADGTEASLSFVVKPVARVRVDGTYLFTRLTGREGLPAIRGGDEIVTNHIWRTRGSYQFTRALSLRAIVDYSAVLPDARFIDLERDKRFTADILATYMVNPWTAIYVGYTDGYGNLALDAVRPGSVRPTESVFNSLGRQVFVKVSYLFRY